MSEKDPLIEEASYGRIEDATITLDGAEEKIKGVLKQLGVDRRSAMPEDEDSIEYRLRAALDEVDDVKDELSEEVNYDL